MYIKEKKTKSKEPTNTPTGRPNPFVQRELSDTERADCKAWSFEEGAAGSYLLDYCLRGYKITFREDAYTQSFAAWVIAPDGDDPNAGLILSGRGSTPLKALKQCAYKDHQIFGWGPWQRSSSNTPTEIDD